MTLIFYVHFCALFKLSDRRNDELTCHVLAITVDNASLACYFNFFVENWAISDY